MNKKFYIPFTKCYQKFQKETDFKFLLDIVSLYGKFNDYTFYIWGHSLDVSDIEYIHEVFETISKSRSCVKVFYHSEISKNQLLLNLTHIIGRKKMTEYMKNEKIIFLELNDFNIKNELETETESNDYVIPR